MSSNSSHSNSPTNVDLSSFINRSPKGDLNEFPEELSPASPTLTTILEDIPETNLALIDKLSESQQHSLMGETADLKNDTLPELKRDTMLNLLGLSSSLANRGNLYDCIKIAATSNKVNEIHPDDTFINSKLYNSTKFHSYYYDAEHHKVYSQFKIFEKSFYYNANILKSTMEQDPSNFIEYKFYFILLKESLTDRSDSYIGLVYLQNQSNDIKCDLNCLKLYESFEYSFYKILLELLEIKKELTTDFTSFNDTNKQKFILYRSKMFILIDILNLLLPKDKNININVFKEKELYLLLCSCLHKNIEASLSLIKTQYELTEKLQALIKDTDIPDTQKQSYNVQLMSTKDTILNEYVILLDNVINNYKINKSDENKFNQLDDIESDKIEETLNKKIFYIKDTPYYNQTEFCIKLYDCLYRNKYISFVGIIHNKSQCNLQNFSTQITTPNGIVDIKYSYTDFMFTLIYNVLSYINYTKEIYINDASMYEFKCLSKEYYIFTIMSNILLSKKSFYFKYGFLNDYENVGFSPLQLCNMIYNYIFSLYDMNIKVKSFKSIIDKGDKTLKKSFKVKYEQLLKEIEIKKYHYKNELIKNSLQRNYYLFETIYNEINTLIVNLLKDLKKKKISDIQQYKEQQMQKIFLNHIGDLNVLINNQMFVQVLYIILRDIIIFWYDMYLFYKQIKNEPIDDINTLNQPNKINCKLIEQNIDFIKYNSVSNVLNDIKTFISKQIATSINDFNRYKKGKFYLKENDIFIDLLQPTTKIRSRSMVIRPADKPETETRTPILTGGKLNDAYNQFKLKYNL